MQVNIMMGLSFYLIVVTVICAYFLILSLINIRFLRKTAEYHRPEKMPKVSILLPARNEEQNISQCLDSLLDQTYQNYEILVIDDQSSDKTGEIIREYAHLHPRIKAFHSKPLPPGWKGKQYAIQQIINQATGEIFILTDADTIHQPDSITWAVGKIEEFSVDFISAYTRQEIGTLGEALIVPGTFIMTALILPLPFVYLSKNPRYSMAIGQFMAIKRDAFLKIGGYESVKDAITEDMGLARKLKEEGFKTIFLDAKDFVSCRMYENYAGAFTGISRSLYSAINKNILYLFGMILLVLMVIVFPEINLVFKFLKNDPHLFYYALPVFLFQLSWSLSLYNRKMSLFSPFLSPLLFADLILMALFSMIKTGYGKGIVWKDRLVK